MGNEHRASVDALEARRVAILVELEALEAQLAEEESTAEKTNSTKLQGGCAASHGAQVGSPACCGQQGKVTQQNQVCPGDRPVCVGYVANLKWGACVPRQVSGSGCTADAGSGV